MSPESGAALFESFRRVLQEYPHMAVYVVRDDRIDVVAVIDAWRDPNLILETVSERDHW